VEQDFAEGFADSHLVLGGLASSGAVDSESGGVDVEFGEEVLPAEALADVLFGPDEFPRFEFSEHSLALGIGAAMVGAS
jgi:hypothetical protein